MKHAVHALKGWLSFAGIVLVVAVLYWAQAVFIPIAIAILLTFVLTPPVWWLQRWLGRGMAVIRSHSCVRRVGAGGLGSSP